MAKKDTRQRLLKTAEFLFSKDGYDGVATKRIASEAGVTEMTLFNHFESKALLYKTVVKEKYLAVDQDRVFVGLNYNDLEGDLQKITYEMSKIFLENRSLLLMLLKEKDSFHSDDTFEIERDPVYKRIVPFFEIYEQKGLLSGQADHIALLFMSSLKGMYHLCVLENKKDKNVVEIIKSYVSVMCNGIKCHTKYIIESSI